MPWESLARCWTDFYHDMAVYFFLRPPLRMLGEGLRLIVMHSSTLPPAVARSWWTLGSDLTRTSGNSTTTQLCVLLLSRLWFFFFSKDILSNYHRAHDIYLRCGHSMISRDYTGRLLSTLPPYCQKHNFKSVKCIYTICFWHARYHFTL